MIVVNQYKLKEFKNKTAKQNRSNSYLKESDPLFFKYQRGEIAEQEWLDKIEEIKERYPYEQ
jgi:uncharacterized membrane protein